MTERYGGPRPEPRGPWITKNEPTRPVVKRGPGASYHIRSAFQMLMLGTFIVGAFGVVGFLAGLSVACFKLALAMYGVPHG